MSGRQATFKTSACCNFQPSIDDNAYIMGIIERMKEEYNIDSNRVYLVGHSNGMSYQLAYNNSESIAAIVSLAGANAEKMTAFMELMTLPFVMKVVISRVMITLAQRKA